MAELNRLVVAADDMSDRFNAFLDSLPTPTKEDEGRFYHVVTGISRTATKNYALLREALNSDDQQHLAWACRNLLELDVFMKCVLISEENLQEFASFRWIDGLEVIEKLISLEARAQQLNPSSAPSQLAAKKNEFIQKMGTEGIVRTRHLNTREWAVTAGLVDEFDIINKICSKLVHPTPWSVLTEDQGSARFPDAYEVFYYFGTLYFSDMFMRLKEHIKQYGVKSAP